MRSEEYETAVKWLRLESNLLFVSAWLREKSVQEALSDSELADLRERAVFIKNNGHKRYILQYYFSRQKSGDLYYSSIYDRYWMPALNGNGIYMEPNTFFSLEELIKLNKSKADKQVVTAAIAVKEVFDGSKVVE